MSTFTPDFLPFVALTSNEFCRSKPAIPAGYDSSLTPFRGRGPSPPLAASTALDCHNSLEHRDERQCTSCPRLWRRPRLRPTHSKHGIVRPVSIAPDSSGKHRAAVASSRGNEEDSEAEYPLCRSHTMALISCARGPASRNPGSSTY